MILHHFPPRSELAKSHGPIWAILPKEWEYDDDQTKLNGEKTNLVGIIGIHVNGGPVAMTEKNQSCE